MPTTDAGETTVRKNRRAWPLSPEDKHLYISTDCESLNQYTSKNVYNIFTGK